jgi:hypothetical protein
MALPAWPIKAGVAAKNAKKENKGPQYAAREWIEPA